MTIFAQDGNPVVSSFDSFEAAIKIAFGPIVFDSVLDAVSKYLVLFGAAAFLKVLCDARSNRFTRYFLRSFPSKEDKWELRIFFSDLLQDLEAVQFGHIVVADDAIKRDVTVPKSGKRVLRICFSMYGKVLAFALEKRSDKICKTLIVFDMEDINRF
ncbi:hypothetical protein C496_19900 [Natronorubrum tibetense GA33]|uniref:Uncharacterized protein n=1 Tax=Natronorubrum tibetense GA33 TaxID=1114856 RepID=L9VKR7_9EURY|nr:hypothetical protein C496_19900 [Natronorubrum tibetense GA33]